LNPEEQAGKKEAREPDSEAAKIECGMHGRRLTAWRLADVAGSDGGGEDGSGCYFARRHANFPAKAKRRSRKHRGNGSVLKKAAKAGNYLRLS
jgi:hypothetical protein